MNALDFVESVIETLTVKGEFVLVFDFESMLKEETDDNFKKNFGALC